MDQNFFQNTDEGSRSPQRCIKFRTVHFLFTKTISSQHDFGSMKFLISIVEVELTRKIYLYIFVYNN